MSGPVRADNSGAVYCKHDRKRLQCDVVYKLIVGALCKRGIQSQHRLFSAGGKSRRKGHGVLLGNAHIEESFGKPGSKADKSGAVLHGRGHRADTVVELGEPAKLVAEYIGTAPCAVDYIAGFYIKAGYAVVKVGLALGGRISLALAGAYVYDRADPVVFRLAKYVLDLCNVFTVYRSEVMKPELLEEVLAHEDPLYKVFKSARALNEILSDSGHRSEQLLRKALEPEIPFAGAYPGEMP